MTQEALKMALEALETYKGFIDDAHIIEGQWHWIDGLDNVQTAIKEALRENAMREVQRLGQEIEQEPVKYSDYEPDGVHHNKPPQRTWVGLTDDEQQEAYEQWQNDGWGVFYNAIEAKLKQKNMENR